MIKPTKIDHLDIFVHPDRIKPDLRPTVDIYFLQQGSERKLLGEYIIFKDNDIMYRITIMYNKYSVSSFYTYKDSIYPTVEKIKGIDNLIGHLDQHLPPVAEWFLFNLDQFTYSYLRIHNLTNSGTESGYFSVFSFLCYRKNGLVFYLVKG